MKGIILYSSHTGNTARLAAALAHRLEKYATIDCVSIANAEQDLSAYDFVLLGGWAESGLLNKAARHWLQYVDATHQPLGIFMTMGAHTDSAHADFCRQNIAQLLSRYQSLGAAYLQGRVDPSLMEKLMQLPETIIPSSVKTAMQEGVNSYEAPTNADYDRLAEIFIIPIKKIKQG